MKDDGTSENSEEIAKEVKRLTGIFKGLDAKKKNTTVGLIERAAFMRIKLKELEEDINVYGFTEWFQQGEQEPYKRQRPESTIYCSMNTSYQKIIKQLTDLLPKEELKKSESDGFDDFVSGRDG